MNSKIFLFILLIIGGLIIFGSIPPSNRPEEVPRSASDNQTGVLFTPQTQTFGAVTVEVVPVALKPGEAAVFSLTLNTHSVELDQDFLQITNLTDDLGNTYTPQQWTGGSGGHHLSGQLIFDSLNPKARELTLTLTGIDNQTASYIFSL